MAGNPMCAVSAPQAVALTTWPQARISLGLMKRSESSQSFVAFSRCSAALSAAARSAGFAADRKPSAMAYLRTIAAVFT